VADLQVSLGFLLENVGDVARELERAGRQAGGDFGKGLNENSKKAFDDLVGAADRAAKEAGLRFNRQKLQFETAKGDIVSPQALASIGKTVKGLDEARKAVDIFKNAVQASARESTSNFSLVESAVTGVAVSLTSQLTDGLASSLGSIKQLVGGFVELDSELRLAAAAAGEAGGYERLGAVVEKVGIDAAGTSKQVAELATSLVRAGFSVKEVEGALPGVVRGAEATGTSFQQFGDIVGNTLRGFGLEVEETGRVVDVLTNTANSSNASIEGLGYTFEYTAPIAKALGVSLEDVAAATGLMANAGIQGSAAGTGLREALQKLQQAAGGASPEVLGLSQGQERLQAVMQKLGISVLDAQGKLLPLEQVFLKLKSSLEELSQGDQVQLTNVLFGDQAGNKILAITNQSSAAISKMFGDIKNSSGATDTARDAMAGFGLELQQLQGTLDSIGVSIGSVAAAGLRPLLGLANAAAGAISSLPAPIKESGGALVAMGAAATGAAVAMVALNVAVNNLGGWAALASSIKSVSALLLGPIGAGTIAVLGLGAAAYGIYGAFNGVDSKTKSLIQTMAGLATFVAVMRGIVALQELWNARLKITVALQTISSALSGPQGWAKIGIAIAAAGAAYAGMGALIKETGGETDALADKSKGLKDEIAQLQSQIDQAKKLKVDTSELESLLGSKMKELQEVENPLEIKIDIEKAEAKVKALKEELNKLNEGDSGRPAIQAQIDAVEKYRDVLKAADEGMTGKGFAKLNQESKDFVAGQKDIEKQIQTLRTEQVELPVDAKLRREEIDKQIIELQKLAEKNDLKFKASLDMSEVDRQLAITRKKKAEAEASPVSRGAFESGDNFARRQVEQAKEVEKYTKDVYTLETKKAELLNKQVSANEQQVAAAATNVANQEAAIKKQIDLLNTQQTERESGLSKQLAAGQITQQQYEDELRTVQKINLEKEKTIKTGQLGAIKDQNSESALTLRREIAALEKGIAENQIDTANAAYDKEKDRVDLAKDRISIEQEVLEVADKVSSIDKKRLQTVEQIVDAFSNLADAQNNLVKSQFDVKSARNSRDIFNAEKEKEAIQKDAEKRGVDPKAAVEAKEKEINALKERGKEIEKQALEAAIEGAATRFQIERKALELKQASQLLDQQGAVRAAERNLIGDQKRLLELEGQMKDPTLTADQKAIIAEQIALQRESIELSGIQVGAEKDRLGSMQTIFSLERQTLEAKQQAEANGFRSTAASEGWEESLQMGLDKLDQQAGKIAGVEGATRKGAIAWEEVSSAANGVLDVIDDHTEAVDMEKAKIGELAQAYKGINQGASFDGAERIFNDGAPTGGGFAEDDARQSADRIIGIYASAEDQISANRLAHFEEMIAQEQQYQRETDQLAESIGGAMNSFSKPIDDPFANYDRFLENAKRQFSPEAIREAIEGSNFSLSDLIQPAEPIDLQVTADTSEAQQALSDLSVTEENFNLQGLDDSFSQIGQAAGQQFSSAFDSSVQFDSTGQQFDDAFNVDGTLNSLNAVSSTITGLKNEYQTIEPGINDADQAQDDFGNGISSSITAASDLANSWAQVASQIRNAASELDALRSAPATPAFWAGGYATAGRTIQVNEIGPESFLDGSGALRMINAPQYGHWNPPSDGVVIPADVTARLKAVGAFGGHQQGINEQRARASSMPQNAMQMQQGRTGHRASAESSMQRNHMSRAMAQQINAMNMLNKNIDALTRKDWNVSIRMPSNAGLLRTVQGL
jgi:TP901 family phage tail tape measure protein